VTRRERNGAKIGSPHYVSRPAAGPDDEALLSPVPNGRCFHGRVRRRHTACHRAATGDLRHGRSLESSMKRERLLDAVKKIEGEGLLGPGQGEKVGARLSELLFPPRDAAGSAAAVIAWLGGILIAAGLLSFVALNWEELGKSAKLGLIFVTLAGLHAAGYRLAEEPGRRPALGTALTGAAMLAFGGAIGLVAQIYHLSSHYPNAILVWWALNAPFALLSRSRKLLLVPLALSVVWLHMHVEVWFDDLHGPGVWLHGEAEVLAFGFLEIGLGALLAAAAALCRGSAFEPFAGTLSLLGRAGALVGLFILSFEDVGSALLLHPDGGGLFGAERIRELGLMLAPAGCVAAAALLVAGLARARRAAAGAGRAELEEAAVSLAAAAAVALAFLAFAPAGFLAVNALLLAAVLALVMRGTRRGRPSDVNLAVVAFLAAALARYFEFVAKGFESVLAFVGAGVLLLALGGFLERKRRAWVARATGSSP
jgi:hypothetical protein